MYIHHIAIWSNDIDILKNFYVQHFDAKPSLKYVNPKKGFQSYFLDFKSGCKLEIMSKPDLIDSLTDIEFFGLSHFAVHLYSKKAIQDKVLNLSRLGIKVISDPRTTGDGYYEAIILDPERNQVELVFDPSSN